jgi:4-hydroxybenzoate polyprenyltransferase
MHVDNNLFWLVFVKRFIFMFVLCLLFDLRDLEIDREEKINTLPVKLGKSVCYKLSYVLLGAFVILSVVQYIYLPQLPFLAAMVVSSVVTFWVIEKTKANNSDVIYLAGIDGMMLLQAMLVYAFSLKL